jgi:hypothetical protein
VREARLNHRKKLFKLYDALADIQNLTYISFLHFDEFGVLISLFEHVLFSRFEFVFFTIY